MSNSIILKKYEKICKIGSGTFGNVYKCKNMDTKETVAIKKFKKRFNKIDDAMKLKEVEAIQALNHQHIIKTKSIEFENGNLYLI